MIEFYVTENNEIELLRYDADATLADLAAELESFREAAEDLKTGKCKGCGECCSDNIPVLGLDFEVLGIEPAALSLNPTAQGIDPEAARPDPAVYGDDPAISAAGPAVSGLSLAVSGPDPAVPGIDPGALSPGPAALPGMSGTDPGQAAGSIIVLPDRPDMAFRGKAIREMCEWTAISELEAAVLFEYNNAEPLILARQASGECCFLKDGLCSVHDAAIQLQSLSVQYGPATGVYPGDDNQAGYLACVQQAGMDQRVRHSAQSVP